MANKNQKTNPNDSASLLTKRELIAAIALAGMLAGHYAGNEIFDDVRNAVGAADELIAVLNETNK